MIIKVFKSIVKSTKGKFLLCANVSLASLIGGLGDTLEQQYEITKHELDRWNRIRTRNMAIVGGTCGIVCHYWYNYLDTKIPGRSIKAVTKKVLADQLICSPISISLIFATLAILEHKSFQDFQEEVKNKFWKLYCAEWLIWPSAQFINFYILPLKYRVLYDNTISLGYDMYASYVVKRNTLKVEIIESKETTA